MNLFFIFSVPILLHNFKNVEAAGNAEIQGHYANLRNIGDSTYLTANAILSEAGVTGGDVRSEPKIDGSSNQTWDGIRWRNAPDGQFWIYPKSASLNEVTTLQQTVGSEEFLQKNLVELDFVLRTSSRLEIDGFLIRSVLLNQCITSHGAHTPVTYETCDKKKLVQVWTAERVKTN